jgi:putative hydrolase of the HAD superfamily
LQAVIFDLDDTLYPERDYVLSGFRAVARWASGRFGMRVEETFAELRALFESGVRGDTFDRWSSEHGIGSPGCVREMVRVYRAHTPSVEPYADVRPVLERLREEGRVGLLTDGVAAVQRRKLEALRLADLFDAVVFSDEVAPGACKPSPAVFAIALDRIGVPAASTTYVGDNPSKDFIGARAVGMKSIRVRRADGLHRHVEPASASFAADAELLDLEDLQRAVSEFNVMHRSLPMELR